MSSATGRESTTQFAVIADDAAAGAMTDPLQLLRRTLRGRYPLVLLLALLLGAIGAVGGYHTIPPKYESTGLLRVESTLPSILYDTRENRVPPNFDAYVAAQATLVQSRRVLDAAVADTALREAGWPQGTAGVAQLQDALAVERRRGEQVISVSVTHPDPVLAQTAVNAVIRAFAGHLAEPENAPRKMVQTLTERAQVLEDRIQSLREEQLEVSNQYGPEAIDRMHANKVQELIGIDQKLTELALAREASTDDFAPAPPATSQIDPLADLREQKQALEAEIASWRQTYGPKHPVIRELARKVQALEIRMQLRQGSMAGAAGAIKPGDPAPTRLADFPRSQLQTMQARYGAMRDRVQADAADLGRQKTLLAGLGEKLKETTTLLQQTRQRLDELHVEGDSANIQRVQVAAWGEKPVEPLTDRRAGLAAAGVIMGMALAVGFVFVVGLVDPRCRYVDELLALDPATAVIGCLPDLGGRSGQRASTAALAVHQLRNLLELREAARPGGTYAITSATCGEGKTSLALALASSFAIAGRRTLIIDTDLVHTGLTRELGLQGQRGLWQSITDASGGGEIHPTMRLNLWAMPVGTAEGAEPTDLSFEKLRWIIESVRKQFDAVVIDTGSLLHSLEASLVAAAADDVIMVVARQRSTRPVQGSLRVLEQIGATCAGLVFNRAAPSDLVQNEPLAAQKRGGAASFVLPGPAATHHQQPAVAARIGMDEMGIDETARRAA
ncbi:MAG: GumC family protein [Planctomycetota bacterium]|jgi:uncharacterized protein involved in exopolysaccharide biosynthesis/Mrp family chromosome partitioning ATPase